MGLAWAALVAVGNLADAVVDVGNSADAAVAVGNSADAGSVERVGSTAFRVAAPCFVADRIGGAFVMRSALGCVENCCN